MPENNKYEREVVDLNGNIAKIDVYVVLEAFGVNCSARQHAVKKLLCSGVRGKADVLQDLAEAGLSNIRAIQLQRGRETFAEIKDRRADETEYLTQTKKSLSKR